MRPLLDYAASGEELPRQRGFEWLGSSGIAAATHGANWFHFGGKLVSLWGHIGLLGLYWFYFTDHGV